jgi:hypothetical protein
VAEWAEWTTKPNLRRASLKNQILTPPLWISAAADFFLDASLSQKAIGSVSPGSAFPVSKGLRQRQPICDSTTARKSVKSPLCNPRSNSSPRDELVCDSIFFDETIVGCSRNFMTEPVYQT